MSNYLNCLKTLSETQEEKIYIQSKIDKYMLCVDCLLSYLTTNYLLHAKFKNNDPLNQHILGGHLQVPLEGLLHQGMEEK